MRSHFAGRGFVAPRVLPEFRRRGVGTALLLALSDHIRSLGRDELTSFVYADEPDSIAFAERHGAAVVDYQLEQIRLIGSEARRRAARGNRDREPCGAIETSCCVPRGRWRSRATRTGRCPATCRSTLDEWLRDEATRPDGSFVALEGGEVVGYAGMLQHANGPAMAENGLVVVRRDRRGRGISRALTRAQLAWADRSGVLSVCCVDAEGQREGAGDEPPARATLITPAF